MKQKEAEGNWHFSKVKIFFFFILLFDTLKLFMFQSMYGILTLKRQYNLKMNFFKSED